MSGVLRSLRRLVLGETWSVPAGVVASLVAALLARSVVPHDLWARGGGFFLAGCVFATLVLSLRLGR
jgi:hypothetical protein